MTQDLEPHGTQLITLDPKKYVAAVYATFRDRLDAAKSEALAVTVVDISTKEGLAVAIKHRAAFRAIRIDAEKARVARKAPILEIGRLLDSTYKGLEQEVTLLEDRFDGPIKAEEKRKEDIKNAALRAEQERLAAEEKARRDAEEKRLADERLELQRQRDELARKELDRLEAERLARLKIEEEERAARARIEEQERVARQAREAEEERLRKLRVEAEEKALAEQRAREAAAKSEQDRVDAQRRADDEARRRRLEAEDRLRREAALAQEMVRQEIMGIQHQAIIAQQGRLGVRVGGTIECIEATLAETEAWPITVEKFGDMVEHGQEAKDRTIETIRAMLSTARQQKEEEARIKAERDKLEAERRAAEELAAKARRAKEDADRLEREKQEAEQREIARKNAERLDARAALIDFRERFGHLPEYAAVVIAINAAVD